MGHDDKVAVMIDWHSEAEYQIATDREESIGSGFNRAKKWSSFSAVAARFGMSGSAVDWKFA